MHLRSIISASLAVGALASQLPPLSGPFPVGTVSLPLVDHSRLDPLAPSPQDRELMISLFYPTDITTSPDEDFSFAPVFSPAAAPLFDAIVGVPNGTSAAIISRSYLNAPLVDSELPILLFGHGYGGSRLIYTSQLEELASHGWIVVAVDHTFDAIAVEFPDGRIVPQNLPPGAGEAAVVLSSNTRAADYQFIVDSLSDPDTLRQIPGLEEGCAKLRTDAVGAFGHSLGGAASAQAMSNYSTFTCGANFDGSMYGPVTHSGLDKPFVQMTAHNHTRFNDKTWAEFWENLDGFKREFNLNGTFHITFEDVTIYRDLLGDDFPMEQGELYGTLPGGTLLQIETEFMDAFFGSCFKGQDVGELDQLLDEFPEVSRL